MIQTELVEHAYDYSADLVAATVGSSNRLDKNVQRLFLITGIERRESPAKIRRRSPLEPDTGSQSVRREASVNVAEDLESLFHLPAAVEDPSERDRSIGAVRLELHGPAERLLIALLNQQFRLGREQ